MTYVHTVQKPVFIVSFPLLYEKLNCMKLLSVWHQIMGIFYSYVKLYCVEHLFVHDSERMCH